MTLPIEQARKAARTRKLNKIARERWESVDKPARDMNIELANRLLQVETVLVYWRSFSGRKLKNGARYARLLSIDNGGWTWTVLIDGYKHKQQYHPMFWSLEPIQ